MTGTAIAKNPRRTLIGGLLVGAVVLSGGLASAAQFGLFASSPHGSPTTAVAELPVAPDTIIRYEDVIVQETSPAATVAPSAPVAELVSETVNAASAVPKPAVAVPVQRVVRVGSRRPTAVPKPAPLQDDAPSGHDDGAGGESDD